MQDYLSPRLGAPNKESRDVVGSRNAHKAASGQGKGRPARPPGNGECTRGEAERGGAQLAAAPEAGRLGEMGKG